MGATTLAEALCGTREKQVGNSICPRSLRHKLIEQIGRLVISSLTKPLTAMKAGMFDASETLCSLEVRPTATTHVDAYDIGPASRTRMTIGVRALLAALQTPFPSLMNKT